ncbi:MAG: glycerophosphodiester phosphodiesterase [Polaromonas sp.]|nr:glycerophosphodiester phosphodiesterase [Polaromonas sp.]
MRSFFDSLSRPDSLGCRLFLYLFSASALLFLPCGASAFDLQGHRGARGLAPENTLAAFEHALKVGVTTLELDIAVTTDGVVVVSHDPYLNPALTRNARGQWLSGARGPVIRSLTLARLKTYDVGRINPASPYAQQFPNQQPRDHQRIPTLAEVFELVKAAGADEVRFNIETKISPLQPEDSASPEAMTRALLTTVREAGMSGRVTVQSFDWRTLRLVQRLEPGMPTSCLSSQSAGFDTLGDVRWTAGLKRSSFDSVPAMVKAAGCTSWSPNQAALGERAVELAHALDLQVLPWTVNAAADMRRLLDWRVDGIITDYPDRLRNLMQQRSMLLPATTP